jgi:peptide-methionine (S)-S-oxide reductase
METATRAFGPARLATATLAGGCFWCTEAVFKRVKGVESVTSGYTGGESKNPTYEETHQTGLPAEASAKVEHAEALQIEFDPKVISFDKLLDVFFATHDPTTLNRQGIDIGPQYRSAIFYHSPEQKNIAEQKIKELTDEEKYEDPIVTAIEPFANFYAAQEYHQNFYESGNRPDYCRYVIDPKIQKLLTQFKDNVKEEYK